MSATCSSTLQSQRDCCFFPFQTIFINYMLKTARCSTKCFNFQPKIGKLKKKKTHYGYWNFERKMKLRTDRIPCLKSWVESKPSKWKPWLSFVFAFLVGKKALPEREIKKTPKPQPLLTCGVLFYFEKITKPLLYFNLVFIYTFFQKLIKITFLFLFC